MCAANKVYDHHDHKPSLIGSVLRNKCSRCRRGNLYKYSNPYRLKHFMEMYDKCPVCGQQFEIEVGFFYGTGFVSYALSVALCVATFVAWKVLIGMSLHDNRVFWWMGINGVLLVLMQPLLMRLSRTIWLYFFVWYDPNWIEEAKTPERTNLSLKNDW
ncbi:MAG: DUF983 domain-containing protein [Bacteroidetes bacterium]|nr:DUF983 domain-containing protein [Bacteroidota bacterium]